MTVEFPTIRESDSLRAQEAGVPVALVALHHWPLHPRRNSSHSPRVDHHKERSSSQQASVEHEPADQRGQLIQCSEPEVDERVRDAALHHKQVDHSQWRGLPG